MLDYFEGACLSDQVKKSMADVEVVVRHVGVDAGDPCKPPLELLLNTLPRVFPDSSAA